MADRKLKIDIRRDRILELLRQSGRVQVSELSQLLEATPVTIRNDLDALERDGYLTRVQGGALLRARPVSEPDNDLPARLAEKQAIAQAILAQIPDGSTLFLNSGTTTQVLAAAMKNRKNLNVVTNSLAAALELGKLPMVHVLLLGGELNAQFGFTYGSDAQAQLLQYQADWAILSVDGVSTSGVTSFHAEETAIDRMMIDRAKQVIIAADYTKIGRAGFSHICSAEAPIQLVTDQKCASDALRQLELRGVTVTLAERRSAL